ncbi:TIGR02611 family protein [Cryobacterium melibiosiphilum]|uniref:TIGR02611 family protein n=1 Tax=Cryobacterium melibiosiphilum TaxID=995039 RepID=A0A3A5MBA3_9MICO|nr:TIGR02611 family protein [Cryobacterium melibiosiphilum]RJT84569.1 TIGR02611 family protein [Cryobacterium melibiosiphilum]
MSPNLNASVTRAADPQRGFRRALHRARARVERHPHLRWLYRAAVAVLGVVIVVVGIVLIPLPGPGWLIVFVGLATLGTEFPAAHRLAAGLTRILTRALAWWRERRAARAASQRRDTVDT